MASNRPTATAASILRSARQEETISSYVRATATTNPYSSACSYPKYLLRPSKGDVMA